MIGRIKGYHGITLAAASLTGLPANHRSFDLPLPGFIHTMTPHFYHAGLEGETEEEFATRCAEALDALIVAEGPDTVAAFIAEPIMGAGGVIIPPKGYFPKIQAVLRKHDVLMIADEVICGFGRTGNYWGSQTMEIEPDILTCAKALSSSYLPISAVMVNEKVFQALAMESHALGTFGHGYTYSGHPVPAAVAIETLKIYDEIDIVGQVRARWGRICRRSSGGDLRIMSWWARFAGLGMIGAVELVADRATRRNFDPALKIGARLVKLCEHHGVIARSLPNDSLAFSPPLIITVAEIDAMLDGVSRALDELTVQLRREMIAVVA